ncbi:hypothetical protein D9756_004176 [Leucocoprinus leucothites]|uniref:Uracil-DNA glycosylase n=1 Tax=Leucocoprinus leucothites TaxID=201217 RepID=A0A8H5DAD4_9AGAR|nr:hypothetical protein D9756_004176 [Leucoagaricus leucothites]
MPKTSGTSAEGEMLVLAQTVKTTTRKSRTVSSSIVVAAATAGSSKRSASIKKSNFEETKVSGDNLSNTTASQSTVGTKRSREVIQAILDTLEEETMHASWRQALAAEFTKPYFKKLKQFLLEENTSNTVYPPMEQIYSWSRLTPLDQVKVVILGQDPYHNVGQAHGLSFSVLPPTKPPGSLKNIYKQLSQDISDFKTPNSGDLSHVAELGVLWLNTSLTVRAHKAGSHSKKGWETFTAEILRKVLAREDHPGVVFMAWGLPAQKTCDAIGVDPKKHLVLKSAHPSPLSAHKGFLGNEHFKKANEWLEAKYGNDGGINWKVLSSK